MILSRTRIWEILGLPVVSFPSPLNTFSAFRDKKSAGFFPVADRYGSSWTSVNLPGLTVLLPRLHVQEKREQDGGAGWQGFSIHISAGSTRQEHKENTLKCEGRSVTKIDQAFEEGISISWDDGPNLEENSLLYLRFPPERKWLASTLSNKGILMTGQRIPSLSRLANLSEGSGCGTATSGSRTGPGFQPLIRAWSPLILIQSASVICSDSPSLTTHCTVSLTGR